MENQDQAGILWEKGVILGSFDRENMMEVNYLFLGCMPVKH